MFLKIKPEHPLDNKLVHIFFDDITHPAIKNEPELAGKLKKLMSISLQNCTNYPYVNIKHLDMIDETLEKLASFNLKYAVIWYDGTWPKDDDFEVELIKVIEEKWSKTDWLAAGHIINRKDDLPQWHEQCIIINLEEYVGNLSILSGRKQYKSKYPDWKVSLENIHDDYTPMWVAADGALNEGDYEMRQAEYDEDFDPWNGLYDEDILNQLFPIAFANGYTIHNLPYEVRQHKICSYIEDDLEHTKGWMFDYDLNTRMSLDESRSFGYDQVSEDKRELFQYKVMDTHIMYVTNTEDVPYNDPIPIDTLVVPCSGLHQYKHLTVNKDTLKRILWTDFSPFGIGWQEHVLKNWDGRDFDKFYNDNFHVIMDLGLPSKEFINYDKENAEEFIDSYGSEEEWLKEWDRIRTLDHQFIKIDVVKEYKRLADLIGKDNSVLLQLSNIWQYEINYINSPHFTTQAALVDLFNTLLFDNCEVYFTGDTPAGMYYEYQNIKQLGGIY